MPKLPRDKKRTDFHRSRNLYQMRYLVGAALVAMLEFSLILAVVALPSLLLSIVLLHLALSLILFLNARVSRSKLAKTYFRLLGSLVFFSGPFGAVAAIFALMPKSRRMIKPLARVGIQSNAPSEHAAFLRLHEEPANRALPIAYADIMRFGEDYAKQKAIANIASNYRPAYKAILLRATRDANPAIRVQAASAIVKIESRFYELYAKGCENTAEHNLDPLFKYAKHCDDYAYWSSGDPKYKTQLLLTAIANYQIILCYKSDLKIIYWLGRAWMRLRQPVQAKACFAYLLEQNFETVKVCNWLYEIAALHTLDPHYLDSLYSEKLFSFSQVRSKSSLSFQASS